ncbi:hypothetical protein STVIR_3268 [Streptomyces viridochromogenes Tue57]|uniref:Uncharacterized protein n=1 Tax=Streptomyces viridochromogenes Tue57 TaxID=1160705 RepID=L8PIS1_STRVR|nr:hypothetical protein STVIR_3268 [Streptomyces viridochromogenes Tue57]
MAVDLRVTEDLNAEFALLDMEGVDVVVALGGVRGLPHRRPR